MNYNFLIDSNKSSKIRLAFESCDDIIIRDYSNGYSVVINNKEFIFDGVDEPATMVLVLTELKLNVKYTEIANNI